MTEIEAVRECEALRHDDPRDARIAAIEAALRTIARREAPGSDNDDWAEVEFARAACDRIGVEWK